MQLPVVGVTCQVHEERARVRLHYVDVLRRAGALPILLAPPPDPDPTPVIDAMLRLCHGVVLTGGDDPAMEHWGRPTNPAATIEDPRRQRFEETLLARCDELNPEMPQLGVCLGMQFMALHAGGDLNQHLADDTPTHADHLDNRIHTLVADDPEGLIRDGTVTSCHHQAVADAGALRIIARAHDGVIEAIRDPRHEFRVGVQWHPERTPDAGLGSSIFDALVQASRRYSAGARPVGRSLGG